MRKLQQDLAYLSEASRQVDEALAILTKRNQFNQLNAQIQSAIGGTAQQGEYQTMIDSVSCAAGNYSAALSELQSMKSEIRKAISQTEVAIKREKRSRA